MMENVGYQARASDVIPLHNLTSTMSSVADDIYEQLPGETEEGKTKLSITSVMLFINKMFRKMLTI